VHFIGADLFEIIPSMITLFIELTNQLFWAGYAEQLAKDNPAAFQLEFADFMNAYNQ
jgi:hypothetical protein